MDAVAEAMTGVLAGLLEVADLVKPTVDPRSLPWRFGSLSKMAQSPLHYWWAYQQEQDDRLCLRIGAGTHAILFEQPYIVFTGKVRNGKAWTAFSEEHAGKVILNAREFAEASAIADAVRRNRDAVRYLFDGTTRERRLDWKWLGRDVRSTPDAYSPTWVTELKSTRNASPERFVRDAGWRAYHCQLALYGMALADLQLAGPYVDYAIVAVESAAPHPVTVFRVAEETIERGRRTLRLWAERALACEHANEYPGYVQSIADFDLGESDDPFSIQINGEEMDL